MTCVIGAEADACRSGLPEKAALRVCVPTGNALKTKPGAVVSDAGRMAKGVAPSKNVTVPRGNMSGPGVTCACSLTGVPNGAEGSSDVSVVVLAMGVTVTVRGVELLGA